MGVQRQDFGSNRSAAKKPAIKGGPLWGRLLSFAQAEDKPMLHEEVDFEPIHLHITPGELHPMAALQSKGPDAKSRVLDLDTFKLIMDQVPATRTIEFSGRQDPFNNAALLDCVDYAYKYNGAESTIYTEGFSLGELGEDAVLSDLHSLVIRIHAHRPSAYAMATGRNANHFVQVRDNVAHVVRKKRELEGNVEIDLVMTVDRHNYTEMEDMIRFAEAMGVDGVRFENYLSPTTPGVPSDRSLYSHYKPVTDYFAQLRRTVLKESNLVITLPTLLDADMSNHRNCLDPFTTVSIDAEFNVSGCSRNLLYKGKMSKIWDKTFWDDPQYHWLREIHAKFDNDESVACPLPCQNCPRNVP